MDLNRCDFNDKNSTLFQNEKIADFSLVERQAWLRDNKNSKDEHLKSGAVTLLSIGWITEM